jgi:hypothetical protein
MRSNVNVAGFRLGSRGILLIELVVVITLVAIVGNRPGKTP